MTEVNQEDVNHALEILGLTLPVTPETLARTRRVLLYTWNPARYSNLTNNPKKYMEAYKKAEEMTKLIDAAYALLSAVLVPDDRVRITDAPVLEIESLARAACRLEVRGQPAQR